MTATLMLYAVVTGVLIVVAAAALERAAAATGRPRRWIWLAALGLHLVTVALAWEAASRPPALAGPPFGAARLIAYRLLDHDQSPMSAQIIAGAVRALARLDRVVAPAAAAASGIVGLLLAFGHIRLRWLRRRWREAFIDGMPVMVSQRHGPAVAGVLTPRIVLPEWAMSLPPAALDLLLAHERSHLDARDPLVIHLAALALVAMPWNPAAWWLLSRLRLAVELDCDARVLAGRGDDGVPAAYADLLLDVAARRSGRTLIVPAMLERSSTVARRIGAMCPPRRRLQALRILFSSSVALVLLVLTGLVPMPSAQAAPVVAAVPNTQTEEFGKGAYRPGVDGVTFPRVVHSVDPKYSEAAKQANLEGLVRLDIVIEPDGTVGAVRVLKSLDQKLGLDQAAVDAAWQWTFEPATLHGEKVAVVAQLEMEFRLHSR